MQTAQFSASDVAIFSRIFEPDEGTLSAAAARAFLAFSFSPEDQARMCLLSEKAQEGTLTRSEQAEINNYEKVGHILSLMKSKARRSLKRRRGTNGKAKHQ